MPPKPRRATMNLPSGSKLASDLWSELMMDEFLSGSECWMGRPAEDLVFRRYAGFPLIRKHLPTLRALEPQSLKWLPMR